MPYKRTVVLLAIVLTFGGVAAADNPGLVSHEESKHLAQPDLPPHLRELLIEEMRSVSDGVKSIAPAIGVGAYEAIDAEAKKIEASYILNKRLSEEEARYLEHSLPEGFKILDFQFHNRARALASAAREHDSDLVLHHYNKLLETCVACHSQYAASRFPELAPRLPSAHHAH